ncbi:polysaccharide biosynthesis/export family protein [Bradyrhizobium sp. 157]|uniref:polysaccharide biosynthesis/export family protein n=1 Tax=Bradyrhizobium sp. 157 TaxID=2782631 RepID=UPI001FF980E7
MFGKIPRTSAQMSLFAGFLPAVRGTDMRILLALLCVVFLTTGAEAQALKSGDSLSITVLQDPKLDRTVVVDPAGEIAFPLAGHIRARGLTPLGLENILKNKLKNNYKDENLDVTVAVLNSPKEIPEDDLKPKIFITGEIIKPGSYVVRQKTTLMQAIALAGGIGPFAAKNRIQVRRKGPGGDETIFMFNYRAYEAGDDLEGNITLRAGDVIMVPERRLFE